MRLWGTTTNRQGLDALTTGRTDNPTVQKRESRVVQRTGTGQGTRRTRNRNLIRAVGQRVNGALVKGMVIALLVGGAMGCLHQDRPVEHSEPVKVVQVQAKQTMTSTQAADLAASFQKAAGHATHTWRDMAPYNADGTLNAYIEIPSGETTKYEFDLEKNALVVDRELHPSIGGYPVNYGFVPQSFAFDGDPFDVLVLGPAIPGGQIVSGKILGIMQMDDEKGRDPKVVISPVDANGDALYELTTADKAKIGAWFDGYKKPDAHKGKWSKVTGWNDATEGKSVTDQTHDWFESGR